MKEQNKDFTTTEVTITVTGEQAEIISSCLDFAARFSMGQIEDNYLPSEIKNLLYDEEPSSKYWLYKRDLWNELAGTLKKLLHPNLDRHAHKSFAMNTFTKNCCSIHKMIEVQRKKWVDQFVDEPLWNVNSSFTNIYEVPVAKVEIKNI